MENLKVMILDSTLREGEQTPGVSFRVEEKIEIAKKLDEIGVSMIEAGSPMVSEGVKEAIKKIAKENLKADIISHIRPVKSDVDLSLECDVDRVAIFIGTSKSHREAKLRMSKEEIEERILEAISYSRDHGLKVRFTPEDATRTEWEYLLHICKQASEAGADRISVADTVGIMTPNLMYDLVSKIHANVKAELDLHCHNDLGLAVANCLAGVQAGANVVHTTVNGLGERTGITPLSEVAVALKVHFDIDTGIKFPLLSELSSIVERYSGVYISPNTPIIGTNAFSHKAGIHTSAVLVNPETYEAFDPSILGRARKIIVDKYAGKHAVKAKLDEMGINVNEDQLKQITMGIKDLADKKKRIEDSDILTVTEKVLGHRVSGESPEMINGLVFIQTDPHIYTTNIIRRVIAINGVSEAYEISGDYDIIAHVQAKDVAALNECLEAIRNARGVEATTTKIVLKRFLRNAKHREEAKGLRKIFG
ncbi:MAG: homocitrate synthase [Candidatus Jordarchaeum sp.]|uniref:homocitrate synthase n=1 Tax=Candidatus Jordarchaeum sp. TaxID=2823881 RepID=UPI00404AFBE5